jgi:hypothetical protein
MVLANPTAQAVTALESFLGADIRNLLVAYKGCVDPLKPLLTSGGLVVVSVRLFGIVNYRHDIWVVSLLRSYAVAPEVQTVECFSITSTTS